MAKEIPDLNVIVDKLVLSRISYATVSERLTETFTGNWLVSNFGGLKIRCVGKLATRIEVLKWGVADYKGVGYGLASLLNSQGKAEDEYGSE